MVNVGLPPSPLMSMFTDMANVSALGLCYYTILYYTILIIIIITKIITTIIITTVLMTIIMIILVIVCDLFLW